MTRSSKCRARAPRRVFSLVAVVVGCVGISGSYACYSSTEAASPVEASDAGGAEGGALSFDAAREDDASSGHPPPDSGVDAGAPVVVCTSGTTWAGGDHGSAVMHPGEACIACHTTDHGPKFAAAGTVFPTSHEPDDCNGSNLSGLATVKIIDARNVETDIPIDTVGNFHAYADQVTITPPYGATVVEGAMSRAMTAHQTVGDCNTCHTSLGANGAPGRIVEP